MPENDQIPSPGGAADPSETGPFAALADRWWDPKGPFAPLHEMNPLRCAYLRDRLAAHFGRDPLAPRPLSGLAVLDAGAGGGLVAEPLARLGARVTGIDAEPGAVAAAKAHAEAGGLEIDYREGVVADLAPERFDAVLALEIVEHLNDPEGFVAEVAARVKPGGLAVFSTINRTPMSLLKAKVAAEWILGWLPRGTHEFAKFPKPSELAGWARRAGLALADVSGMSRSLSGRWSLSRDLSVNYLATVTAPPAKPSSADYGGLEAGLVDREDHGADDFGRRVDAMKALLERRDPRLSSDTSRRGQEDLPQHVYDTVAYYERWLLALKDNLVELGYLTEEEIARRIEENGDPEPQPEARSA